ncbi:MAG: glycosyltransferase family 2 protein [Microcoleus sp. CSU_2_2]|nr:glycosyltransferase family 2 protein [Microcoleus sp. SU_5_3]NJS10821.1 glycosyltransferase family 2 protein [Microcoleus sp. CSU_2_2]
MLKISVVIPSYRRPKDLARCLDAFKKQKLPASEVLVVVRDTDTETWAFIQTLNPEFLPLRTATVIESGVIAAMNAGMDAASGEIVAFTDDDAAPHTDWLERIETHFLSDSNIGGVGGRDWVYHGTQLEDGKRERVGQVQWFGRVIGGHHLGVGEAREVDVLKGVNMSFRRSAIGQMQFDRRMRGTGAQVHFELAFSLALKRAGWKLIYDPKVAVDHFPAQRFDEDRRNEFNDIALLNAVHNETLVLLENLPSIRRTAFVFWATFVGTRDAPGFLQWLRFLPKEGTLAGQKLLASLRGRWQAWETWQQSK